MRPPSHVLVTRPCRFAHRRYVSSYPLRCSANSHQRDYLPVAGLPALRADIAAWGTKSLYVDYSKDDVLIGPGTKELLFVLQTVYYGDLLLPNPSCTSYAPQANIAGRFVLCVGKLLACVVVD